MFNIDPVDMIYQHQNGKCFSTVCPGFASEGIELLFLGDFFLRNVVAVFDYGAQEMRFAARTSNTSSIAPTPSITPSTGAASTYGAGLLPLALAIVIGLAGIL